MKKQMKNAIRLLGAACISSLLAVGCSSSPAPDLANSQTVDLPSSASANTEPSATGAPQEDANTDTSNAENGQNAKNADSADQNNTEGKWHVLPPEIASVVDADFEGTVWKIDGDSFYIAENFTEVLDDGSIVGGGPSPDAEIPDSELILVAYEENTHFYTRTIYNGGDSYEDTEATFQNIVKGLCVELKGSFENDVFHATEIRIVMVS